MAPVKVCSFIVLDLELAGDSLKATRHVSPEGPRFLLNWYPGGGSRGEVCDPASLEDEHRVREKQEGASALPARCGEGALDVLCPSRLQDLQLQPQCARGTSRLVHKGGLAEPGRRVPEHGDAAEPRNDLLEQLELLLGHLRGEESEASDVLTRVSEAGYETAPLGECRYDDRYGLRSLAGGAGVEVVRPR